MLFVFSSICPSSQSGDGDDDSAIWEGKSYSRWAAGKTNPDLPRTRGKVQFCLYLRISCQGKSNSSCTSCNLSFEKYHWDLCCGVTGLSAKEALAAARILSAWCLSNSSQLPLLLGLSFLRWGEQMWTTENKWFQCVIYSMKTASLT